MTESRKIFSLISCLFLTFMPAMFVASQECPKDSPVDTRYKPEGNFTFPLTKSDHSKETCHVTIRSPSGGKTQLILQNVRPQSPNEQCPENSVEISNGNPPSNRVSSIRLCSSVGGRTPFVLSWTTIVLSYTAISRNVIARKNTQSAVSVYYKRLDIQSKCKVKTVNKPFNFQSPSNFKSPRICQTWNLTAPRGQVAALSFFNVYLFSTDDDSCKDNFLEVWDGKTNSKYCDVKKAPKLIVSKGRKLVVTYHSKKEDVFNFQASFTSISPSSYKTNCFVESRELKFKCNNKQVIPCEWQCDGAMQCSDNSDESMCSNIEARWRKLQVFVIVMGSMCASTVIFCVGLICFRKCIIQDQSLSSRLSRFSTNTDQTPLTPNTDLPSPPPCYFTDQGEESPASIIRGTYFFGDEFSQSSIHNASLLGIPPPRYCSTESVHQSTTETRSIWQRSMSSIPLVATDTSRNSVIASLPEENPPDYESLTAEKDQAIMVQDEAQSDEAIPRSPAHLTSSPNECIANSLVTESEACGNELNPNNEVMGTDIGRINSGTTLNV